ncbi:MAG TPA: efflux RND transporter periplasmic adaptor subunit [Thermoanaerobaculia bacterium]|jgi:membrane fusion protein (multidrug efflux system)|nr:efflux RND transporter periplasmic adaptor subunit [Thermoanaerobaculia bacterium]
MKRVFVLLWILLLLVAGCGGPRAALQKDAKDGKDNQDASAKPPLPADVADLEASPAKTRPAEESDSAQAVPDGPVNATGELVSPVRSELAVRLPGRVGRVMVDEGQRVRRGQPLLQLETQYLDLDLRRAEADLARARAAVEDAERDFKRKQDLIAKGSVSQAAYDKSRASYDAAVAAVAAAEAARDLARQRVADSLLRSPIDGVVAERRTDVGERLGDNSVAFVVVQTSPLKLRFRLPERYLSQVKPGQEVRAQVDPYPGETFTGRVSLINGVVDTATRTVGVETEFPNRDGRLKPGLFARVELDLGAAVQEETR